MDTDDLSEKTRVAILWEAEKFNHDLTLQFGLLSYECSNEEEYIKESLKLIRELKKCDMHDLDDIFFGNPPPKAEFLTALKKIEANIGALKSGKID